MQTKEDYADRVTIQIVAFPQSGISAAPGRWSRWTRRSLTALNSSAGWTPARSTVSNGRLDTIFRLVEKHDVDVDIHLHEPGELGALYLELIAERTKVLGWRGLVTVSHAFCLGSVDTDRLTGLIDLLVENDIVIMSTGPGCSAAPPIVQLRRAVVRVCTGNDGIQDAWGPLNRPDMLLRMYLLCYRNHFRRDAEIEMVIDIATNGSAEIMGIEDYGFATGKATDLVLVYEETHVSAVVKQPMPWLVTKRGQVTVRDGELV